MLEVTIAIIVLVAARHAVFAKFILTKTSIRIERESSVLGQRLQIRHQVVNVRVGVLA